jgi:hypothetical protein
MPLALLLLVCFSERVLCFFPGWLQTSYLCLLSSWDYRCGLPWPGWLFGLLFFFFETRSFYVGQAGLKLTILLPQLP